MKIRKFNEGFPSDPVYDNEIRERYYEIGDNLPGLIECLEIAANRGSEIAKKELVFFKQMEELFEQSTLGSIL